MKEKLVGIYKIECNVDNKKYVYIGKSINIKKRWYEHILELKENKHNNIFMQRLYNKYKIENFNFDIIKKCNENELNENEIYYIKKYKNDKNYICINMTDGGDGGNTYKYLSKEKLEEIKNKNSKFRIGKSFLTEDGKERLRIFNSRPRTEEEKRKFKESWTDERRKNASEKFSGKNNPMYNVRRFGKDNPMYGRNGELAPMYGKHHSEEAKKRMSESRKGKYVGENNPMYGKHRPEELKKLLSDKNSKCILCLNSNYDIINKYKNNKICKESIGWNIYNYLKYNKEVSSLDNLKKTKDNLFFIYEEDYIKIKGGDY